MTEESIFAAALDKDPAERAAFLDAACGPDQALRRAIEQLLAVHEEQGILDRPALAATTAGFEGVTVGAPIGPYTLVQELDEGGMGSVWVAKQSEPIKRRVALKLIKPGMDSKAVVTRFEHERQALAIMDHPNIARVFDGGMTPDGRPYFVMELVNGLPLTKFCDEAKMTPHQRLDLFLPICLAVQHAHQKGIVHRDLKPSNILVTLYDGRPVPKIIDFGIAKALAGKLTDESLSTQFGATIGTLEYMAPEQAGLSALDIDTRADIYSLGVILYELLTGLKPIDGKRLREAALHEMVRILQEEEPPRPSTRFTTEVTMPSLAAVRQMEPRRLSELLRGELDWIVMKCLEKSRDRRYESVSALARDIQRYLADEPVEARPPSFGYRAGKFFRRHKGPVLTAAAVVVLLVGGVIGTTLGMMEALHHEAVAIKAAKAEESAKFEVVKANEEALASLWGAYFSEANARRFSGRPGQRFESLKAIQAALKLPLPKGRSRDELRNLAIAALALPDFRLAAKTWGGWPEGSILLDFDPVSLRLYARGDRQGNISVGRMADDVEVARSPGNGERRTFQFGPDGETLLVINLTTGTVKRWKYRSDIIEDVCTIPNLPKTSFWKQSRDGGRLLGIHPSGVAIRAEIFDLRTGRKCFDHSLPIEDEEEGAWGNMARTDMSPDGRWLARPAGPYGSPESKEVLLFNLDTGAPAGKLAHPDNAFAAAWHPDSRTLAVSGWNANELFVWDVPSKKLLYTLRDQKGGAAYLTMNSSGQLLASSSHWAHGQVFWHPHTGKPLLRLPQFFHVSRALQDGRLYSYEFNKNEVILHIAEPSPILRTLVPFPATGRGECRGITIHPDGRLLAVGHVHGVSLFDLATGLEVGQIPLGVNLFACFDPSKGDLLTYGKRGLFRWPVQFTHDSLDVAIGPPHMLGPGSNGRDAQLDVSGDGKTIVVANYDEAVIYRQDEQRVTKTILAPLVDTRVVRITTDGRWVITRQHDSWMRHAWDAQTGQMVRDLPIGEVVIAPSTHWLMTDRNRWNIDTGEKGPPFQVADGPGPMAFSPDGTIFAGMSDDQAIHVVDAKTGKTLVQLGLPEQSRCWHASFSRDGSRFVHQSSDHHYVYAWDLREVRRQLAEMGLDWGGPPYFSEEKMRFARSSYTVRVNAGVLADDAKK